MKFTIASEQRLPVTMKNRYMNLSRVRAAQSGRASAIDPFIWVQRLHLKTARQYIQRDFWTLLEARGLPEFEDFFQTFDDAAQLRFGGGSDALMKTLFGHGADLIQDGNARLPIALHGDRQGRCCVGRGGIGDDDGRETRIV
jgi:hypothetical protein